MAKKRTATNKAADFKGKALGGKSEKGKEFDPTHQALDALSATLAEVNEPRPYSSRYPIPEKEFHKLKEAAHKTKLGKGAATIAKDKGKKTELSVAAVAEFAAPGGPVAAAPITSRNFAGFAATGWIP